jgi:hypothetical protein
MRKIRLRRASFCQGAGVRHDRSTLLRLIGDTILARRRATIRSISLSGARPVAAHDRVESRFRQKIFLL